jgi:hypothetical protein
LATAWQPSPFPLRSNAKLKMATRELSTRSAFQVPFKGARLALRPKRDCYFDLPRAMLGGTWARASIVFAQTLFQVVRDPGVMKAVISFTDENIDVYKRFHSLACQAVVFGAPRWSQFNTARLRFGYGVAAFAFSAALQSEGWARQDSNLQVGRGQDTS